MKGKALRKNSLHEKTAVSVLLNLFISSKPSSLQTRSISHLLDNDKLTMELYCLYTTSSYHNAPALTLRW